MGVMGAELPVLRRWGFGLGQNYVILIGEPRTLSTVENWAESSIIDDRTFVQHSSELVTGDD